MVFLTFYPQFRTHCNKHQYYPSNWTSPLCSAQCLGNSPRCSGNCSPLLRGSCNPQRASSTFSYFRPAGCWRRRRAWFHGTRADLIFYHGKSHSISQSEGLSSSQRISNSLNCHCSPSTVWVLFCNTLNLDLIEVCSHNSPLLSLFMVCS